MFHVRNILTPLEFTSASVHAVDYAAGLAKLFNARLHLLHVIEDVELGSSATAADWEAAAFQARRKLKGLGASLREVECVPATRPGIPADEIVNYAAENGIDLIIMATAGRKGVARLVIGSVTETVVRSATCPVLSLRHADLLQPGESRLAQVATK